MILRLVSFFVVLLTFVHANGATHITPMSQYGQIQNVQNYSSNPFWDPNGPYNQHLPRPVYVDGPDLNSGDCQRTVSALVSSFCAMNNNCHDMRLMDIRPSIMLQLSRLPGHNWATQCMGYIDGAFSEYQSMAQGTVSTASVGFPQGPTVSNPDSQDQKFKIQTPFTQQIPEWAREMQERKQEIKELEAQTNNFDATLSYATFPKTFQDLSFKEQMQIKTAGYEPYKDKSPYQKLDIDEPVVKEKKVAKVEPKKVEKPVVEVAKTEVEPEQSASGTTEIADASLNDTTLHSQNTVNTNQGNPVQLTQNAAPVTNYSLANPVLVSNSLTQKPLNNSVFFGDMPSVSINIGGDQNCNDCPNQILNIVSNYFAVKPWATYDGHVCTENADYKTELVDMLYSSLNTGACLGCGSGNIVLKSCFEGTIFCCTITIGYDEQGNMFFETAATCGVALPAENSGA